MLCVAPEEDIQEATARLAAAKEPSLDAKTT